MQILGSGSQGDEVVPEESARSDNMGNFTVIVTKLLDPGVYTFTARVTDSRGARSNATDPLVIKVSTRSILDIIKSSADYALIIILILLILGGIDGVGWVLWYRLLHGRYFVQEDLFVRKGKESPSASKEINSYVARLKTVSEKRELTTEEKLFLKKFDKG